MVRSTALTQHQPDRPDPARIAGISVAILVNLTLFGVLMRPISYTEPTESNRDNTHIDFLPQKPRPITPPVVPVTPHHQPPRPQTPSQAHLRAIDPPPVINRDDSRPIDTVVPPLPASSGIDDNHDVASTPVETSLVPIASPAPPYPPGAINDGSTGTVLLELVIGTDGRVLAVHVVHSSGDRRLDAAARDQVLRNWRFEPAMRDGKPVEALGRVPIVFRLDGQ
jgi:protein TonB